tara:strand:- start:412 stop:789 length:378 start_codon:yes stop_codon:yes gene_type:complete
MKRFLLLQLLATLALPTSVNAETVYLRCNDGIKRNGFKVTIYAHSADVSGTTTEGIGESDMSIGVLYDTDTQFKIRRSFGDFWEFIEISRVDGSYKIRMQNKQIPSISEVKSRGYCSKKELKTIF